ncbi:MAG: von Willebrand factor type A domain-containing protein [Oscillospiraceae bacterium]|nr:von Willebrand factor type A domain-containing protein [Oscillospiraceae bacterium]
MNVEYYAVPPVGYEDPAGMNFKEFIRWKMKAVPGSDGRKTVTAAELADALGVNIKVLLDILNGRRAGPDRRDFVIALCAQLGLDADDTNDALGLFPGTLRLLSADDGRDREIMRVLNADFDREISFAALEDHLRQKNLPSLKVRYRNQSTDERRNGMDKKKINWGLKSEELRQRYNYYTSLGYDDKTATVLSLYTYGGRAVPKFSIKDAYEAFVNGEEYPPRPKPAWDLDTMRYYALSKDGGDTATLNFESSPTITAGAGKPVPCAAPSMDLDIEAGYDPTFKEECIAPAAPAPAPDSDDLFMMEKDEYVDAARLEAKIAPAAPKATAGRKHIMFRGRTTLQEFDTDEYQPIEEKDFRTTMRELTSTFRMTTNTASVGVLFNQLRNRRGIDRSMVRIEEMLNYFRYRSPKPEEEMFRISTELRDRENGNKLLYINVQGKEEVKEKQNIVVLLDVSGSMTGNVVQTQAAIATVISKLKKGDTFSLVTYSGEDEVVLDGVTVQSRAEITQILEKFLGLEVDGWTNGSAGIEKAYRIGKRNYRPGGNNQVILITDGDLNFGITSQGGLEKLIEEKKKDNLFLSVIGTGLENFKDNKLETLANHGNGVYRVVNNLNDVKKSIRDEYASLVNIIAKDVKAQVEFNPEVVESFRLLGFENRELKHEEFTDDAVISEPFGSGGCGVALYELKLRDGFEPRMVENRYTRVVTTGSRELGTVKVRYKEPLEDTSHEVEHVIAETGERYTDNLVLASVVYVCAEKLRDSDKIDARDEALALADLDRLGVEIKVLNLDELDKLREILRRSREQLGVTVSRNEDFEW